MMRSFALALVAFWSFLLSTGGRALDTTEITLPFALDYLALETALRQQLLAEGEEVAEVYSDNDGCQSLSIGSPRVEGMGGVRIRLLTNFNARAGTYINGHCLAPLQWQGILETLEEAYVSEDGTQVQFRIFDSNILNRDMEKPWALSLLGDWIKSRVHPRFEAATLDLTASLQGLGTFLSAALDPVNGALIQPPRIHGLAAEEDKLVITLLLLLPTVSTDMETSSATLGEEELARWDQAWQSWDAFATWLIKILAQPADPELAQALATTLLEARYDLRNALAADNKREDPVRKLFISGWDRLAPLLRESNLEIPGVDALHYATFISAADALHTLDQLAPTLGVRLDSNSLRALARLLLPTVSDEAMQYDTRVDPELRKLLGLDADFEEVEPESLPFAWIIPRAEAAASVNPQLVKKLTKWVPARDEVADYLGTVGELLDAIARAEQENGKVPSPYIEVYDNLILATAWQETCWRQFVRKGDRVQPILSPAGSVGLMQVNQHVWRGVYSPQALQENIAYNARAGNEILVHYLVDYAIKKKEDVVSGNKHNLARAAYAAYNGGPGHLSRYRNPTEKKSLKAIDDAFWKKYQAIRQRGGEAVISCYAS